MSSFTRNDFAVDLSKRLNLPTIKALKIVDSTLESLSTALIGGQKVEFRNFGIFEIVVRKPKIGRNPRKPTEGQYRIPARRSIKFKMGKDLLEQLNPDS